MITRMETEHHLPQSRLERMRRIVIELFREAEKMKATTRTTTKAIATHQRSSHYTIEMGNSSWSSLHYIRSPSNGSKGFNTLKSLRRKSNSSSRISLLLGFSGIVLILMTTTMFSTSARNDDFSQQQQQSPAEYMAILLVRATGSSLLLQALLSLLLPPLVETSNIALLYSLALVALGQAIGSDSHSDSDTHRIPYFGLATACWILAGWEAFLWKPRNNTTTITTTTKTSRTIITTEQTILVQWLANDICRITLLVTLPLVIVTLGVPNAMLSFLMDQHNKDAWTLEEDVEIDNEDWIQLLLLVTRIFGVSQLAYALLIMDWKDQIQIRSNNNTLTGWMPLLHMPLVNLPLFGVAAIQDKRFWPLVIAQFGVCVWITIRIQGSLRYLRIRNQ